MNEMSKKYFQVYNEYVSSIEENWRNNHLTSKDANEKFVELLKTITYSVVHTEDVEFKAKMTTLYNKLNTLIDETVEDMKTIFVLRTNEDKVIAISDISLVQKCIDRLGKENVKYSKMKLCQSEEDLDNVLLEDKLQEQLKNPRIVHILTDKDCPLY